MKRNYKKRPSRKTYKKRATYSKSLVKAVKAITLKQAETKHKTISFENQALNHNSIDDFREQNPLRALAQGTDEHERIGDEIIGKYINYKIWLSNKEDRPNVLYRIVVYRCPKDESETNHINIYEGITGNKMTDYINTEKYTPIFQKYVKITNDTSVENGASLHEASKLVSFSINLKNQKIKYENGTNFPKYQRDQIRLSITPYDAYGTLTTDNIASYAMTARVYYKDP